ncbi:MAG: ketopantoate reductase family protein [Candidatus Hodarchaeales archaeon]|jgi:2-dehydropantoate 2-reductase
MNVEELKVAIIGAGPSGGILGAFLAQNGVEVTLVDIWKAHIEAIRNYGLQIMGVSPQTVRFDDDHLKTSTSELKDSDINLVFISVKTPYLKQVVRDLEKVISDETLIVIHQNGAGNEDILTETFGAERSFRNVINYAGNILKPGIIDMTFFNPPNFVGAVLPAQNDTARSIAELISSPDFKTEFLEDIQHAVWKKVILNAALAPVCAITGQTMREAMEFGETNRLASGIIKEGIKVTEAMGIQFDSDFHDICMGYLSKGGHHKPSMLIDIENKSPTEIEFLNGKIVEIGKKFNIPVPLNETTTVYVKAIELKY